MTRSTTADENHPHPNAAGAPPEVPGAREPLLSVVDVAEVLGVGERYVRRLVAERRLPYLKIGAKVRFTREDLDHFIASSRREVGVILEPEDLWAALFGREQTPEFLEVDQA